MFLDVPPFEPRNHYQGWMMAAMMLLRVWISTFFQIESYEEEDEMNPSPVQNMEIAVEIAKEIVAKAMLAARFIE